MVSIENTSLSEEYNALRNKQNIKERGNNMSYDMSNNFKYNVRWLSRYKNVNLLYGKYLNFDGGRLEDGLYILRNFFRETRNKGFTANQVLEMVSALSLEDFKERTNFILGIHNELNEAYNECIQELKLLLELDKSKASEDGFLKLDIAEDKSEAFENNSLKLNIVEDNKSKASEDKVTQLKKLVQEQREYTTEEIDFIKNTVINYYEDIWEKPRNRQSYKEVQYIFSILNIDLPAFTGRVASSLENIEEAVEILSKQKNINIPLEQNINIPTEQNTDITVDLENMIYIEEEGIWYNEDDGTSLSVEEYNELRNKQNIRSVEW